MTTTTQSQAQNVEEIHTASLVEEIKRQRPEEDYILLAVDYTPDPLEVRYGRPLPMQLIRKYAMLAAQRASTERLDDGSWYAEIENFPGVWAQGDSEREAIKELETVVRDWTLLKIQDGDRDLPVIAMIDLNVL